MPKLPDDVAAEVAEEEVASFEALPEGIYLASLADVEVKPGNVADYWSWRFTDLVLMDTDPPTPYPGSAWINTSLSENAKWKMKEVFDAFGVAPDTDTDELLGEPVRLAITQRVIEKGARVGEIGTNVDRVMPAEDDDGEPETETGDADRDAKPAPARKSASRSRSKK